MSKQNIDFIISQLREASANVTNVLTPEEKSRYLATLLGSTLGSIVDMPSSPVDIPRNFFLTNHQLRVGQLIGQINEFFPINLELALSIASNIFTTRYRLVYEGPFLQHMLLHMAGCSDDVVPTTISDILNKVEGAQVKHLIDRGAWLRCLSLSVREQLNDTGTVM